MANRIVERLSYKTVPAKLSDIKKEWLLIDATDQYVGRLASQVAFILKGKHKADYTPFLDCGDNVIVVNVDKIKFSGKKKTDKVYVRHTGYPGGQRFTTPVELEKRGLGDRILLHAVKGMLPKNRLGRKLLKNLRVFENNKHNMDSFNPREYKLKY